MAKTKNKKTVSDNFENLKAQMMKKRILAESQELNQNEYEIEANNIIEENNSNNKFINNKEVSISECSTIEVSKNIPKSNVNVSKIIIKKVEKPEQPKRITYYLKPDTIKKIDKYSKMAGMGKSEFVQKLLDEVLNNLEIEK